MARIAGPLVAAELGWMLQGVVDTMMVGRLPDSAAAIGGSALAGMLFYTTVIFLEGILFGMDPLVSQAFGAKRYADCHKTLFASFWFVVPIAPLHMLLVWNVLSALANFGVDASVMTQAVPFMSSLMWSTLPLLLYMAMRHYLQAMNHVKIVMFTLVTANLVNWAFNYLLIYGHGGFPEMGIKGSGWATVIARVYMVIVMFGYWLYVDKRDNWHAIALGLQARWQDVRQILHYGLPAAIQIGLELAVFGLSAVWIAKLGALPIAAHQVALNVVATTYMVPLGIGAAAAVRVGQAIGRRDPHGARLSGWVAIGLGASFMALSGLVLILVPHWVARAFTDNEQVVAAATTLLMVGALFQLFDGIQAVSTGALRGAGETRIPMYSFMFAYWTLGLPIGYWLCFHRSWGARGLWVGFCIALITVGFLQVTLWRHKSSKFAFAPRSEV